MMWLVVALAVMLVATSSALVRERRAASALRVENGRWRTAARQRADRVAVLGHEIRTPLSLVIGGAEMLVDGTAGELTPEAQELSRTIAHHSGRMVTLADDLLVDARIDAGLFTMHVTNVDVRRLALAVVRDTRRLTSMPIRFESRGAPPRVPADAGLVRQVLVNLVNNAVRHAGPDSDITVSVRRMESSVLLSVRDAGAGMDPETKRALLDGEGEVPTETGHGLGLLISRRIAELHGGRLVVDTVSGRGTTITLVLPGGGADDG
ncbi:sensor histidine kinase [Mobilicoccus pelagius]|uniref:histidine kinase n=1 Tax=Mobilicoccus pelagius NBRC 104925 TaxID=1089455 RepID=H5UQR6_9MICO|nr:HAMP domain-containing sensor histidine kinase [Mobilicoccus pelagius]GAB48074.1 putative two-component histidine kinase [Mobilicoccus pelagius NBRC 104925]